jgi:hypothetical protein
MHRQILALVFAALLCACRTYVNTAPLNNSEGRNAENYRKSFGTGIPSSIEVVNSIGMRNEWASSVRGTIYTYSYIFEMLVPQEWIDRKAKRNYMYKSSAKIGEWQMQERRKKFPVWYAPESLDHYDFYYDNSSFDSIHMVVEKQPQPDGRHRVFVP